MAGYKNVTANNPKEEEEEENLEGNRKHLATKPIGGSCGWVKESVARACSEKGVGLDGYAKVLSNEPEEEE